MDDQSIPFDEWIDGICRRGYIPLSWLWAYAGVARQTVAGAVRRREIPIVEFTTTGGDKFRAVSRPEAMRYRRNVKYVSMQQRRDRRRIPGGVSKITTMRG